MEGRLRRRGAPLVPWNWRTIAKGRADGETWALPYGSISLNGGTIGLFRVHKVDEYLRTHQTTTDELYKGLYRDEAGREYQSARRLFTESMGGAALRVQEPGDLDVLVAVARPGHERHAQLGWSIDF